MPTSFAFRPRQPRHLALLLSFLLPVITPTLVAAQPVDGHYRGFGDRGGILNILPPGQDGVLNGAEAIEAQAGQLPPHVADQLGMYGDLVYASPGLTEDRIFEFFKDASFGVQQDDVDRVYSPTEGVTVIRDASFGVPHIFGETRYATMFAQGYTAAEDRLFLMDALRHLGRARVSEFLGASPADITMDREQLAIAPYKEEDLTQQLQDAVASDADGPAVYADLLAYVDGVNTYIQEALLDPTKLPAEYPALQQVPATWLPEDAVAIASLVGGIFGKGGGGELTNFCGIQAMTATLGGNAAAARAIFDDLKFADDAEAPTTSSTPKAYMSDLGPVDPAANPDIDCASLTPLDSSGPSLDELLGAISHGFSLPGLPTSMSNALLVSAEHTTTGRPIAVFGPQTSYYMPQLLIEKDVHGPDIDARGASFAGVDLYVQLGRGRDYAWSATSASADNVDQWVLRLCEPGGGTPTVDSLGYEYQGNCEPIEAWNHVQIAKPSAGGLPGLGESGDQCANAIDDDGDGFVNDGCPAVGVPELPLLQCSDAVDDDGDGVVNDGCPPVPGQDIVLSWPVQRAAHYGPIVARGTLTDGTPIAIATQRTTYQSELGSALGFYHLNNPNFMTDGYESFRHAVGEDVEYTFNWFYIDAADIGYQHSCKCPRRSDGVDPYLPAWGDGDWDWQGFIGLDDQPAALNPPQGYLTSWNNKQAPGFVSNDRNFSYGPVYRSQMLEVRLAAGIAAGPVVRTDVIDMMEDAGTVDLRGQEDLPLLIEALGPTAPPGADPRAQQMRDLLSTWLSTKTHRRDFDHDGAYDHAQAAAIMDAWWPRLVSAMFDTASAGAIASLHLPVDDANRIHHIGSAFQDGFYGHVNKDLRQVLGHAVVDPWSKTYCGDGVLADCRAALWASLDEAAADLEAEFSNPSIVGWRRGVDDEDVRHTAVGITSVEPIHWINRPTFQQVVQLDALDPLKCYLAKKAAGSPGIGTQTLTLGDSFETKATVVSRPMQICNAADVDGRGIQNPGAHLACYRIKDEGGQPKLGRRDLATGDALGSGLRTVIKPDLLCLASSQDGAPLANGLDHFKCYKARRGRGAERFARREITIQDAFEQKVTRVLEPNRICNAVDIDGAGIIDPAAHFACYRIKDARGQAKFARRDVSVATGIGAEQRSVIKARTVCLPAVVREIP